MIITKEIFYDKMKRATVGIAGLGGLGSNVAIALARTGIGKLILVDFDYVERANLNRQQYLLSQVGKLKTDSLKQNIFDINPDVEVEIVNCKLDKKNIPIIFADADIIAECFDKADAKAMITNVFLNELADKGKKLVAASGMAGTGRADEIKILIQNENFAIVGDGKSDIDNEPILTASRVGIVALFQANQIIRWIIGDE
ncbi:sulfur carrier protein ThiS adenylyltransferase ThiF [bacterium]|nr:sulfur carrier protein ThiS adenylyltransferase ThiF [bacterium]